MLPDKRAVRDALREALRRGLETMAHAAAQTREGVTHEDSRAEGDKDMRGTVESYIARGQAMRTEELADALSRFEATPARDFSEDDPIASGALVRVAVDDEPRLLFVCAQGGGTELSVEGEKVTVVTPSSPAGRALLGKRVGDDFELMSRGAMREWVIEALR